jgi:riboflavin synthase
MFSGIVEEVGGIKGVRPGGLTIAASKVTNDLTPGASISVNGACLTVTSRDDAAFSVDIVPETLRRTNLGALRPGDPVNLERPLTVGGRLDGHIVQGHVDGTGTIESISGEGDALLLRIQAPPALTRYVVEKGFIAVDGTSLTVVNCDRDSFAITVIPHTRDNTVFGARGVGDMVNLEVDVIAKYVERLMPAAGTDPRTVADP